MRAQGDPPPAGGGRSGGGQDHFLTAAEGRGEKEILAVAEQWDWPPHKEISARVEDGP